MSSDSRASNARRALASLNHPNIATIYGLEQHNAIHSLVMELVAGMTLHDRITSGGAPNGDPGGRSRAAIPVAEALAYAGQIVEALDAAHERGIVHRDLKPANIKITDDGRVKVLDSGWPRP